jgi:16S rRNA (guanine527-N7)-methyltransferase
VRALTQILLTEGIEASLAERLGAFGDLLLQENRSINLTGAKTREDLAPHLVDSLTLVPFVAGPLLDIGSGGGLPAIPIALATGVEITLIEATGKKARFLWAALEKLGLPGEVVNERAEVAGRWPRLRDRFGFGSARAVGGITTSAELLMCFLRPGGLGLLQRGRSSEADRHALTDAALVLGGSLEAIEPIVRERSIWLVRKREPTPQRFPRRPGIPAKRPLCMKPPRTRDSLVQEAKKEVSLFNEKH